MSGLLAKLFFGATAVGAPSLVLFGGVIDWREGVQEKLRGLEGWLTKAWENGGGGKATKENVEALKNQFLGKEKWEHPGLFVETVGDYMKRILNKGGEKRYIEENGSFEVKNTKQVFDKVGFKHDRATGGIRLTLSAKDGREVGQKLLTDNKDLCILSITGEDGGKIGKLDLLVGFYKGKWENDTLIKAEKSDQMESGYGTWCQRRAVRFNSEKDLVIGIPFENWLLRADRGESKYEVIYHVRGDAVGFVGRDYGENYGRVYATKSDKETSNTSVWPAVLAVIGNKKVESEEFSKSSPIEKFSEIYGNGIKLTQEFPVVCPKQQSSGCQIGVPVGIKFNNVKITGKSLADWSTKP